jgi:hypothetical protein
MFYTISVQEKWKESNAVISSDVRGYYAYLPALFIHNDLKFNDMSVYVNPEAGSDVWVIQDTTKHVNYIKYTCGMAILYSPFFLWADANAGAMGYSSNGYSEPYRFALVVG